MKENKQKKKPNKKNKKSQEDLIKIAKAACIILVVLMLLFVAADRFGNITFSSVGDYFSGVISGAKSGDGYPYCFESATAENVEKINSDLLVLTDGSTFVLDATAKKMSELQHSYSVPLAYSKNGRAVMIDVGGYSYRVQSKTKVLYDGTSEHKLLTAAIGKDGSVALATRGDSSMSELTVFNKNQKEVFKWECAKEAIVSVDISDNGKKAAVSVVGAENGELYSKVIIFDFKYSEPISEYSYSSQNVSKVEFIGSNKVLATGEDVFSIIEKNSKQDEDLSLNKLSRIYTADNNTTVAVFSKYGSSSSKIIKAYTASGKLLFTQDINSNVRSVSCDGSYISVLTDRQLISFNKKGKTVGTHEVASDGISCFTDGNNTYILTTSAINCYKTVGESTSEKPTTTENADSKE